MLHRISKMKVGVIGTGVMGQNHARNYADMKGIEEVVLFDVFTEAAEKTAEKLGVSTAPSIDKLLDTVDAVSICVPTQFHKDTALQVLESGVAALIEKPVCSTVAEGEFLIEHVPKGAVVGVGHIERFNPIIPEIAKIADKPHYVSIRRHNPASARIVGTPVVEDLMIHDIDIAFNIFVNGSYDVSACGSEDVMAALINNNGTPVCLSASRKASKKIRKITVETEDLTVEGNFMTQEIYIFRKAGVYKAEDARYVQENVVEKVMVPKVEPLKLELQTFLQCAENKTQFPISLEQGVENLRICEKIHKAAGV
ncbi:MAG TPA: Gfo/Idh/MocA family oxidoreductase [Methanocorpusculum sp.]|nr:Gfo/Idh/MocA family oxidoreductase [Methanocorpusculum sp.]